MTAQHAGEQCNAVIVEDEPLYRDLLALALAQDHRIKVVGTFADGESALDAIVQLEPDVALLDIELPGAINGIQLGLHLRRQLPKLGIVLLSNHGDPQFVASLPKDVISGWSYLLKKSVSNIESLRRAIEGALAGFVVLDPQLVAGLRPGENLDRIRLTPRQREILALMAEGLTNRAIANRLVLAEKSVENQINALYQQLGIDREDGTLQPRVKAVLLYLEGSTYQPQLPPRPNRSLSGT